MNILFVASADFDQGSGHVVRCIRYSEILLRWGHSVSIVGPIDIPWVLALAQQNPALTYPASQTHFDLIILDSYDEKYLLLNLEKYVASCVIQICDSNTPVLDVTSYVWLDTSDVDESRLRSCGVPLVSGLEYMGSVAFRAEELTTGLAKSVLVTLGGAPSLEVLQALSGVVLADKYSNIDFHFLSDTTFDSFSQNFFFYPIGSDLQALVEKCDTVISNAGTTLWDVLTSHRPTGALCLVENQVPNYKFALENQLVVGLGRGWGKSWDPDALDTLFFDSNMRRVIISNAAKVIDGESQLRLLRAIEAFALAETTN
jgi:spore coat polysaccharide biosynthesis predicted glycosyltransferase SpsG